MPAQRVRAVGHEHVRATHASTLELTTDGWLTPAGDCILGIEADTAPAGFDPEVVAAARRADTPIALELRADGHVDRVRGRGDPGLTFASERCMIVRTSTHVDDRTVMIGADGAAADLDRALVTALREGAPLEARLTVGESVGT